MCSLLLKYILEHFEAKQPSARPASPLPQAARCLLGRRHQGGPHPWSLERLMAACSTAGEAHWACSLDNSLSQLESAHPVLLEGTEQLAAQEEDAHHQEEMAMRELPLEPSSDDLALEWSDSA